ncbi:sulfur carrier protein ThiS [bacterium]|nr:sulfur carrier protein ThiS [bacterium]
MKRDGISLVINGKQRELDGPQTVADFVTSTGFKPTQVIVELNGEVVERNRLGEIHLQQGDRLEVIIPVAGG